MLSEFEVITRMCAAALAAAIIGWERQSQHKPAGLRTHMLVALGASAFVQAGLQLQLDLISKEQGASADIMKIIGGIVGGVGFLGAGSIIRAGGGVQGLTTAATIWLAAAIGVACGLGYYVLAANCVLLAIVILVVLGLLERLAFSPPQDAESKESPGAAGSSSANPQ
jgi:putative Mg2+ transporter-C (MgtC) family protein